MISRQGHSISTSSGPPFQVFVIYNRARSPFAITDDTQISRQVTGQAVRHLQRLGFHVFSPDHHLYPGATEIEQLKYALPRTTWTVIVLSKDFLRCNWPTLKSLPVFNSALASPKTVVVAIKLQPTDIPDELRSNPVVHLTLEEREDERAWRQFRGSFTALGHGDNASLVPSTVSHAAQDPQLPYRHKKNGIMGVKYRVADLPVEKSLGSWYHHSLQNFPSPPTSPAEPIPPESPSTNRPRPVAVQHSPCSISTKTDNHHTDSPILSGKVEHLYAPIQRPFQKPESKKGEKVTKYDFRSERKRTDRSCFEEEECVANSKGQQWVIKCNKLLGYPGSESYVRKTSEKHIADRELLSGSCDRESRSRVSCDRESRSSFISAVVRPRRPFPSPSRLSTVNRFVQCNENNISKIHDRYYHQSKHSVLQRKETHHKEYEETNDVTSIGIPDTIVFNNFADDSARKESSHPITVPQYRNNVKEQSFVSRSKEESASLCPCHTPHKRTSVSDWISNTSQISHNNRYDTFDSTNACLSLTASPVVTFNYVTSSCRLDVDKCSQQNTVAAFTRPSRSLPSPIRTLGSTQDDFKRSPRSSSPVQDDLSPLNNENLSLNTSSGSYLHEDFFYRLPDPKPRENLTHSIRTPSSSPQQPDMNTSQLSEDLSYVKSRLQEHSKSLLDHSIRLQEILDNANQAIQSRRDLTQSLLISRQSPDEQTDRDEVYLRLPSVPRSHIVDRTMLVSGIPVPTSGQIQAYTDNMLSNSKAVVAGCNKLKKIISKRSDGNVDADIQPEYVFKPLSMQSDFSPDHAVLKTEANHASTLRVGSQSPDVERFVNSSMCGRFREEEKSTVDSGFQNLSYSSNQGSFASFSNKDPTVKLNTTLEDLNRDIHSPKDLDIATREAPLGGSENPVFRTLDHIDIGNNRLNFVKADSAGVKLDDLPLETDTGNTTYPLLVNVPELTRQNVDVLQMTQSFTTDDSGVFDRSLDSVYTHSSSDMKHETRTTSVNLNTLPSPYEKKSKDGTTETQMFGIMDSSSLISIEDRKKDLGQNEIRNNSRTVSCALPDRADLNERKGDIVKEYKPSLPDAAELFQPEQCTEINFPAKKETDSLQTSSYIKDVTMSSVTKQKQSPFEETETCHTGETTRQFAGLFDSDTRKAGGSSSSIAKGDNLTLSEVDSTCSPVDSVEQVTLSITDILLANELMEGSPQEQLNVNMDETPSQFSVFNVNLSQLPYTPVEHVEQKATVVETLSPQKAGNQPQFTLFRDNIDAHMEDVVCTDGFCKAENEIMPNNVHSDTNNREFTEKESVSVDNSGVSDSSMPERSLIVSVDRPLPRELLLHRLFLSPVRSNYFDYFRFFGRRPLYSSALESSILRGNTNMMALAHFHVSQDLSKDGVLDAIDEEAPTWRFQRTNSEPSLRALSEAGNEGGMSVVPVTQHPLLHRRSLSNLQDYTLRSRRVERLRSMSNVNVLYQVMCHVLSRPEQQFL